MKIGLLGGTFNPPHLGHLILAEEIREKFNLEKIFFIPAYIPPHKQKPEILAEHRLEMLKLAIKGNKNFKIIDWEIKQKKISYTIETIKFLKSKFPYCQFYLIIGSDLAIDFSKWKNYREILKMLKVIVAKRKDFPFKNSGEFIESEIINIEISSSKIRDFIKKNKSIRYLVPEKVYNYIKKNKLYL